MSYARLLAIVPSKNAPLDVTSSSARATTSVATAPAVVSVITPLVSASASRATSALAASPRPSSPKLPQGHTVGPLDLALKVLLNLNENASAGSFGLALSPKGGPQPVPAPQ